LLGEEDFVHKAINKKQITGILSKFMFSIYTNSTLESQLKPYHDHEIYEQFGIHYLSHYEDVYSYENGINDKKFEEVSFL
jgi:CRISPR-associated endonuclease/helicase Cas3